MKVLVIHLSDIHLKEKDNYVIDKTPQLCKAIGSRARYADCIFTVVSGDIANSGRYSEYQQAEYLFTQIRSQLKTYNDKAPSYFVVVPGNHDCFCEPAQNNARDLLLEGMKKRIQIGKQQLITDDVVMACTDVQNDFFKFLERWNENSELISVSRLFWIKKYELNKIPIIFYCYNTAWMSTIDEGTGPIYFPVDQIGGNLFNSNSHLRISVLHHTYNCFYPENYRILREHLENTSNIILMGHEHEPSTFAKDNLEGRITVYSEGAILQDNSNKDNSRFSVIQIDLEDGMKQEIRQFSWNNDVYSIGKPREYANAAKHFSGRRIGDFETNSDFEEKLTKVGAPFLHPRKSPLKLSDIFVYPFIREMTFDAAIQRPVRSSKLIQTDEDKTRLLILGDGKSGKSSLCRTFFIDYHEAGYVPILIDGEILNHTSAPYFDTLVSKLYSEQYTSPILDKFVQLPDSKKIIIIDNLNLSRLSPTNRRILLHNIGNHYPHIIITANTTIEIEDITSENEECADVFSEYQQYLLLQFGHELRNELIDKWNRTGVDEYISEDEIIQKNNDTDNLIRAIIGKNLVPAYPIFLLTLLQAIEAGRPHDLEESATGHYYEYLIRESIGKVIEKYADLDSYYTYLTELANYMFEKRTRLVSNQDLAKLHAWFTKYYKISPYDEEIYNLVSILNNLCKADLIEENYGSYSFKHRFVYYFFAARYLAMKIHEPHIRSRVTDLICRLYHEEFANIVLFLTHHSKNTTIFTEIQEQAKNMFPEVEPIRLESDTKHIDALIDEIPKRVLESQDIREYRKRKLKMKDEFESPQIEEREFKSEAIPDIKGEVIELGLVSQINVACKTIEIIGQILKNYHGSIPGNLQVNLGEEAYLLGLRCLNQFFRLLETRKENIIGNISARIIAESIAEDQIEKNARQIMFTIYFALAYVFIKAISEFIGAESLSEVIRDILNKYQYMSVKLIDLSIKLDHFRTFPYSETSEIMNRISSKPPLQSTHYKHKKHLPFRPQIMINNRLVYFILSEMVIDHLYMFNRAYQTKQRICNTIGINMSQQRLIDQTSVVKKEK